MKLIFSIILVTFTVGCVKAMAQDEYSVEDVSVLEYTMEGQELTLTYQTPLESLYFSPGVKVKRESEGVVLNVVRCGIKEKCEVDSAAKFNDGRYTANVSVPEGTLVNQVFIASGSEKRAIAESQ